jgi:Na+/proline symporter
MNYSLSSIRWLRVVSAALAVIALSFLILTVIIALYAFGLAFQARGAPDQTAINHFAARLSPKVMPWLEVVLTFLAAVVVSRRTEKAGAIHGLVIGILAGLLSLAVPLALSGRLGFHNLVFFLIVVGLGWLGGTVAQKRTGET